MFRDQNCASVICGRFGRIAYIEKRRLLGMSGLVSGEECVSQLSRGSLA